jgi:hypothetical protein
MRGALERPGHCAQGVEGDQGPQHLPHLPEVDTQLEVARPVGREPWQRSSEVRFWPARARILNKFLLKSINGRIHVPLFLDGQTCIGP